MGNTTIRASGKKSQSSNGSSSTSPSAKSATSRTAKASQKLNSLFGRATSSKSSPSRGANAVDIDVNSNAVLCFTYARFIQMHFFLFFNEYLIYSQTEN